MCHLSDTASPVGNVTRVSQRFGPVVLGTGRGSTLFPLLLRTHCFCLNKESAVYKPRSVGRGLSDSTFKQKYIAYFTEVTKSQTDLSTDV